MTAELTTLELVNADLERIAEQQGDLTALVYERFFQHSSDAEGLMGHTDLAMQGRMLQQTLELLLNDEHLGPGGYLDWELDNHLIGYRVTRAMYARYLDAIGELLTEGASAAATAAWTERIAVIMARIDAFEATRSAQQA